MKLRTLSEKMTRTLSCQDASKQGGVSPRLRGNNVRAAQGSRRNWRFFGDG